VWKIATVTPLRALLTSFFEGLRSLLVEVHCCYNYLGTGDEWMSSSDSRASIALYQFWEQTQCYVLRTSAPFLLEEGYASLSR
jgi:hypothetical protein